MKNGLRQLLTFALALTLLAPLTSSSQTTNCTVTKDLFTQGLPSLVIDSPAGCPIPKDDGSNIVLTKSGSYLCTSDNKTYTDISTIISHNGVGFYALCSGAGLITKSTFKIIITFGGSSGGGSTQPQSGYYCNKVDPVKPYCATWTSTSQGQSIPYMQCMTSCQPSRNWVDIMVTPIVKTYKTGQIITFSAKSNIALSKLNWSFGDGIERLNEPVRDQPVVYTNIGKKIITLSTLDPVTNKTISTSTEVKIKCAPSNSYTFRDISELLKMYVVAIPIPADSFFSWSIDNYEEMANEISQSQCQYINRKKFGETETLRAVTLIKRITDNNQPTFISVQQLVPPDGNKFPAGHSMIALRVSDTTQNFETRYQIKFLDPNGPTVMTMDCKISKKDVFNPADLTTKPETGMYCLHPSLGLVAPYVRDVDIELIEKLRTLFYNRCKLSQANFCKEHRNLSKWLETNYPIIDNNDPRFGKGVCAGWSEFVLKIAYLADFVGECASTPTAEVPTDNNANLASTGLLEFLNSLFNQLLRPILTN
jgi:hypothetical protein